MKSILPLLIIALILPFAGCSSTQEAEAQQVGAALIADVAQGTVIASDAYAVYQSVNQNLTSANVIQGKLSVSKVITGAQAISGTLNSTPTQSLLTAANTFVQDVNGQIAALKASGATSTSAITTTVSDSGAATVSAIAATTPTPASS